MDRRWLILLLGVALLAVACGGGDGPDAASPTPIETPTVAPTLPPIATRSPLATATPVTAYPPGTRTGIEVIDGVLDAVEAGDGEALMAVLSFHPYRCDNAPAGVEGSNPCPPGVQEGSAIDVVALGGCEVSFLARQRADVEQQVLEFVTTASRQQVYAVAEVQEGRLASPLPLRYMVILSGGYSLLLDDAGVTHLGLPCDSVGPAQLYHPADRPILPPL